jgi:hypothetical protein
MADRLLLVLCALVVASALLGWMMVANKGLGLSREQNLFAGGCLVYTVTTLYLIGRRLWRRSAALSMRLLAAIVITLPMPVLLTLFRSGILPWPTSMAPYGLGSVALSAAVTVAVGRLLRGRSPF